MSIRVLTLCLFFSVGSSTTSSIVILIAMWHHTRNNTTDALITKSINPKHVYLDEIYVVFD